LTAFRNDCHFLCDWFSFAVRLSVASKEAKLDFHPKEMLAGGAGLSAGFCAKSGYAAPCTHWNPIIKGDYPKFLRGKTLWSLMEWYLSKPERHAKHNYKAMMEVAANTKGPYLQSMVAQLSAVMR
jgi:hypothetical protein